MSYAEHPPLDDLAEDVECAWTRRVDSTEHRNALHLVLPDTCADIIVDLGRQHAFVVGTMTVAREVVLDEPTELVAVRFRPGGALPHLGVPLDEITDRRVDLVELRADSDEVLGEIEGLRGVAAATALQRALARRPVSDRSSTPEWRAAIRELTSETPPRIGDHSRHLGISRQYMTRRIKALVGIGPRSLVRIARLRRLLGLVDAGDPGGWAGVAYAAGYCDQSHMIAEVKALTGRTPTELRPGFAT